MKKSICISRCRLCGATFLGPQDYCGKCYSYMRNKRINFIKFNESFDQRMMEEIVRMHRPNISKWCKEMQDYIHGLVLEDINCDQYKYAGDVQVAQLSISVN